MGKNKKANTRFPLIVASVLVYNWVRKQKQKQKRNVLLRAHIPLNMQWKCNVALKRLVETQNFWAKDIPIACIVL